MEERMTICNMSIEAGARAGMIAPDDTTFSYLRGRRFVPDGPAWERAVEDWRTLKSDYAAVFDRTVEVDATRLEPFVTWGTSPGMVASITSQVPDPSDAKNDVERRA